MKNSKIVFLFFFSLLLPSSSLFSLEKGNTDFEFKRKLTKKSSRQVRREAKRMKLAVRQVLKEFYDCKEISLSTTIKSKLLNKHYKVKGKFKCYESINVRGKFAKNEHLKPQIRIYEKNKFFEKYFECEVKNSTASCEIIRSQDFSSPLPYRKCKVHSDCGNYGRCYSGKCSR